MINTARAKVNLYLHVAGKRDDGYHLLDSLVTFASVGDELSICHPERPEGVEGSHSFKTVIPASDSASRDPSATANAFAQDDRISLKIDGNFSNSLSNYNDNLIIRAAHALADEFNITPKAHITLTKNLPIGAGIGGGSSDAATSLKLLNKLWNINANDEKLAEIGLKLGSDIPVCIYNDDCKISGIGEVIEPVKLPHIPLVLVNPRVEISSAEIYQKGVDKYSGKVNLPNNFRNIEELSNFLKTTNNDLYPNALSQAPILADVLAEITSQAGGLFANMSGSGSTCFGIFEDDEMAKLAIENIGKKKPDWWVS